MKYYSISYLIVLLAGMLTGCQKSWLAEKADKQQAIPATLKDFQLLLNNESLNFEASSVLSELASDGHYTTEDAWAFNSDDLQTNAYTWTHSKPYDMFYWTSSGYQTVFNANIVLDALKTYKPVHALEQNAFNNIKGQALFHRAFAFYRAATVWAPPYNTETANADLGIPLRLEADVSLLSVRSTIKQTYEQIINDLLEAKKLMPIDFVTKTRPYKLSAFALLARVYISMREYDKAGAYADSCLKLNNSLLDYNTLSVTENFIGNAHNNPEILFLTNMYASSFLKTDCFIDENLYNSYIDEDLRKSIFFNVNADNTIGFKGSYSDVSYYLFHGLAIDELYLIRAESYARADNVLLAMKDLNDLLRSRWKKIGGVSTYIDQAAIDATDALNKILNERKKELLLRGLRWIDLRRLNFEDDHKTTLTRTIGGKTYNLEPGSYRYTFPIPNEIISKSGMKQNFGW